MIKKQRPRKSLCVVALEKKKINSQLKKVFRLEVVALDIRSITAPT